MLTHALDYAALLILTWVAFWLVPARARWAVLVLGGGALLAQAGPRDLAIAVALTALHYACGLALERWQDTRRATVVLWSALLLDVGALALFKYGRSFHLALLPSLGLSYYLFQLICYLLEVHWGRHAAERHPGRFAASVLLFPKLIAGPIERTHRLAPQIEAATFDAAEVGAGLLQIGWGVFKKAVIADRIALVIGPVLDAPAQHAGLTLLVSIGLYVAQVYNDFSGYTDIALGSARTLGLRLTPNFDHPMRARSVTEFWRRWHISLSSWTNDYVYTPLSMWVTARASWRRAGLALSIVVTFLVLAAWHGANWTYFVFGLLHGTAVAAESFTRRGRAALAGRLPPALVAVASNAAVLVFYACSCVFFRAPSVGQALEVFRAAPQPVGSLEHFVHRKNNVLVVLACWLCILVMRRLPPSPWVRWPVRFAVASGILLLGLFEAVDFVYMQF